MCLHILLLCILNSGSNKLVIWHTESWYEITYNWISYSLKLVTHIRKNKIFRTVHLWSTQKDIYAKNCKFSVLGFVTYFCIPSVRINFRNDKRFQLSCLWFLLILSTKLMLFWQYVVEVYSIYVLDLAMYSSVSWGW